MKIRDKLLLGFAATTATAWGIKTLLRRHREIDLNDRVVVITGGDGGLGLFLAREAVSQGARVVIAARDQRRLENAAAELRASGGRDVLAIPTDVTDPAQVDHLVSETVARFGRLDVLINNAGVISVGPLQAMDEADFRKAMDVNYWGAYHTSMAAIPVMRRQGSGRIGFVSSIGGRVAVPHLAPYTSSKFALTGLIRSLRVELARENILVTGIYPATIRTGGHTHAWFKGDQAKEYAWFALFDSIPGIATSAAWTAARALRAIREGDPELIVGVHARIAILFDALFPEWSAELTTLAERALPDPAHLDAPAIQGESLKGSGATFFNQLIPDGARPSTN